jgi:hypothetical protein
MFVIGNVMCGPDENKLWMFARITRGELLPFNARYFMRLGVPVVHNFVDSRRRNFVSGFKFFGHCDLLVVDGNG